MLEEPERAVGLGFGERLDEHAGLDRRECGGRRQGEARQRGLAAGAAAGVEERGQVPEPSAASTSAARVPKTEPNSRTSEQGTSGRMLAPPVGRAVAAMTCRRSPSTIMGCPAPLVATVDVPSSTVRRTVSARRDATQTVTPAGSNLRTMGPATTDGIEESRGPIGFQITNHSSRSDHIGV